MLETGEWCSEEGGEVLETGEWCSEEGGKVLETGEWCSEEGGEVLESGVLKRVVRCWRVVFCRGW